MGLAGDRWAKAYMADPVRLRVDSLHEVGGDVRQVCALWRAPPLACGCLCRLEQWGRTFEGFNRPEHGDKLLCGI